MYAISKVLVEKSYKLILEWMTGLAPGLSAKVEDAGFS